MRDLLSKLTTGSMIVGAALLVSACGGTETANTVDNTVVTDTNALEPMDGTATDNMTPVDAATGNDAAMANDTAAANAATDTAAPAATNDAAAK
ncbi:MAG: hypothetical protein ABS87_11425 [Sphingomonas sp. SCN 67-18]|uniref:hypothetical protein n=1 Tax=uncultured Sphingomonas sp. TaxID=158754 RepID=UPI00086931D4|nr:hypothetical protein [Sphingomonas sp. SCN 67-18]ODU20252.1 MAG: hypothetical protein ABS87_11425 [Sphingomonas sp. SCN 67-18]